MAVHSQSLYGSVTPGILVLICVYATCALTEKTLGEITHRSGTAALLLQSSPDNVSLRFQSRSPSGSHEHPEKLPLLERLKPVNRLVDPREVIKSEVGGVSLPANLLKPAEQLHSSLSSGNPYSSRRLLLQGSDPVFEESPSPFGDREHDAHRSSPLLRSSEQRLERKLIEDPVELVKNFTYHDGPILTRPITIYPYWYGNWSAAQKAIIKNFFLSLSSDGPAENSPRLAAWYSIITQYKDISGISASTNISWSTAVYEDNYSLGKYFSDALVNGTTILGATYAKGDLVIDPNGVYILFTSDDVEIVSNLFSKGNQCHFHCLYGHFTLPSDEILTAMTAPNRVHLCNDSSFNSSALPPNSDAGVDTMLAQVASCFVTAVLDPQTSGWSSGDRLTGLQNICPFDYYPNATIGDDGAYFNVYGHNNSRFLMNGLWDNTSSTCALQYSGAAALQSPTSGNATAGNSTAPSPSSNTPLFVGVGAGVGAIILLLAVCLLLYCLVWRKRAKDEPLKEDHTSEKEQAVSVMNTFSSLGGDFAPFGDKAKFVIGADGVRSFVDFDGNMVRHISLEEVKAATSSFSPDLRLGRGGFGSVYKGTAPDGTVWAVKRAHLRHEDELASSEFRNEVDLISRVRHKNLVTLVGFCFAEGEQILVYEYVPNGTLRQRLRPNPATNTLPPLSFSQRLTIAMGTARALQYLHGFAGKNSIIHRDVKSDNILLDGNLEAKLADFGLTRPMEEGMTHITTNAGGTIGYMDPQFYNHTQVTTKSDVYSYGVVLLELVTGLPPVVPSKREGGPADLEERTGLVSYVIQLAMEKQESSIVDPSFSATSSNAAQKLISIALRCVMEDSKLRPEMDEVLVALDGVRTESLGNPVDATWNDKPQGLHTGGVALSTFGLEEAYSVSQLGMSTDHTERFFDSFKIR
eukprot:TRINITY_DN384_c0_g1_i2.p1 TRINITY_DN384_c0_g1~~TRINITY_DN384_c0_g1_i2.p1  ORF type:complete len:919 (+),score=80.65 TRINITY_DN384_c0_g1_i2:1601-4357(+)